MLLRRIIDLILAGARPEEAAILAGLGRSTYFEWTRRGRDAASQRDSGVTVAETDQPFLDFLDSIREAEARLEGELVAHIQRAAARGSWHAAAWFLERRFPEHWARPTARSRRAKPSIQPRPGVSIENLERAVVAALERHERSRR